MKSFLFFVILSFCLQSTAKVEVLFHPYDNTLQKIAGIIANAESTVDMALYNIDTSATNPVIKAIQSEDVQRRIQSGDLKIRILFEGYSSKASNQKKMETLESYGIDARYLGISRKMHHKFATVDTMGSLPILITGSANWSMMSRRHFNENILYFEGKPGITFSFQDQFDLLWSQAKEFGFSSEPHVVPDYYMNDIILEDGLEVNFNSDNFVITEKGFRKSKTQKYVLTQQVVQAIDEAQKQIDIATTRLKLRPIYEALKRAAARGVKINIVVSMAEYAPIYIRKKTELKQCKDIYGSKCSTSQNFAIFLNQQEFPGKENISLRIKYFDLRKGQHLSKQMHSKYMIVDSLNILTGSFNWSYSAEYNHFENLVEINGDDHPVVLSDFVKDYRRLWGKNREQLRDKVDILSQKNKIKCSFAPMTLSFKEIDSLLNAARKVDRKIKNVCL